MEIASPRAHRILAYVDRVSRQGYYPTVAELSEYADAPEQRVVKGSNTWESIRAAFAGMLGQVELESRLDWLTRLGWLVDRHGGRVQLTDLGRALVRALDEEEQEPEPGLAIALDKDDPFAYAQVITRLAQHEDALLVDPYLRVQEFGDIVHHTQIDRVLTGAVKGGNKRRAADLSGLAVALTQLPPGRRIAMRVSEDLHDRFVNPRPAPWMPSAHRWAVLARVRRS